MSHVFATFNDWLSHQDDEALECRDIGHQWSGQRDKRTHFLLSASTGELTKEMPCIRGCGVKRLRTYPGNGEPPVNSYDYSDAPWYQYKTPAAETGRHVGPEHKQAIRDALNNNIPADRIERVA